MYDFLYMDTNLIASIQNSIIEDRSIFITFCCYITDPESIFFTVIYSCCIYINSIGDAPLSAMFCDQSW